MKQVYNIDLQNQQKVEKVAEIKAFVGKRATLSDKNLINTLLDMSLKYKRVMPSIKFLANKCGVTPQTVHLTLKKCGHLFFDIRNRYRNHRKQTNHYVLQSWIDHDVLRMLAQYFPCIRRLPLFLMMGVMPSLLSTPITSYISGDYYPGNKVFSQNILYRATMFNLLNPTKDNYRRETTDCTFEVTLRSARTHEALSKIGVVKKVLTKREKMKLIFDSVKFSSEQLEKLSTYDNQTREYAARILMQARKERRIIDNEALWVLRVCENRKTSKGSPSKPSPSVSSQKGKSADQKQSATQAINREYQRQINEAQLRERMPEEFASVIKRLRDAEKAVQLGQQTYEKSPTDVNLRYLESYKQTYARRKEIHDKMVEQYGQQPLPEEKKIPRNDSTDSFAEYFIKHMPAKNKEEILMMRAKNEQIPGLWNNPVLDRVLEEYMQRKKEPIIEQMPILDDDEKWEELPF